MRPTITQPPELDALNAFLNLSPSSPVPILPEVFLQLPSIMQQHFIRAHGSLARSITSSIFPSPFGNLSCDASEQMTVGHSPLLIQVYPVMITNHPYSATLSIAQLLMESLHVVQPLLALDEAAETRIGLLVQRDQGELAQHMYFVVA